MYNFYMSEDGSEKTAVSRRGFLKLLGIGVGVVAGKKVIDAAAESQWDPSKPEHLKEFLGQEELFAGFHYNYTGVVELKAGTNIFYKPTYYEAGGQSSGKTLINEVNEEGGIRIKNPFIFLRAPIEGYSNPARIKQVVGPDGNLHPVDMGASWIIFSLKDPGLPDYLKKSLMSSPYGLAASPLGDANLNFVNEGGKESIIPEGLDVMAGEKLDFGQVIS